MEGQLFKNGSIDLFADGMGVDTIMMNSPELCFGRLGDADIQFAVALPGIGRDDLRLLLLGQQDGGGCLSYCGRPCDNYNSRLLHRLDDFVGSALFSFFTLFLGVRWLLLPLFTFQNKAFGPFGEIVFLFHLRQFVAHQPLGAVL